MYFANFYYYLFAATAFNPFVDDLVAFIKIISQDENVDEIVFNKAVQMIGDLANIYQQKIKALLDQPFIKAMVDEALKSADPKTKEVAKYATKVCNTNKTRPHL